MEGIRTAVAEHAASVRAVTAIGLALAARVEGRPIDDLVAARIKDVLDAIGVAEETVETSDPIALAPLLADIRADLLSGSALLSDPSRAGSWRQEDEALHQAFGGVSAGFAGLLHDHLALQLDGLSERLASPEARFLDIGTGVGALSIGMARRWPKLRVTGIDPLPQVIELARRNVASAGVADRITLRVERGEEISERQAFDLVFVPSAFIPGTALEAVVRCGAAALKPGGWLLLVILGPNLDGLATALARFRVSTWGGTYLTEDAGVTLLSRCGLADARHLLGRPGAPFGFAAGRRHGKGHTEPSTYSLTDPEHMPGL